MDTVHENITEFINGEDKEKAVNYVLEVLSRGSIDIVTLYEKVINPALNGISSYKCPQEINIWQEHIRTSIVRTIIECCYPYVIKERDYKYRKKIDKKVIVLCPSEEYHEIGPRMVTDFFTLHGYNAIFVGGNTPKEEILAISSVHNPNYIALSVSNYFHLVTAQRAIENIRLNYKYPLKIIVGGYAFKRNPKAYLDIGADILLENFEDIGRLEEGGVQ